MFSNRLLLYGIAFEVLFSAALVSVPGLAPALGMALPPATQLMILPLFPLIVWAPDEILRAVRRRRARRRESLADE